MDQAAEETTAFDLWHDLHRLDVALFVRYSKRDAALRSLGVVVTGVPREHIVEMTASEDMELELTRFRGHLSIGDFSPRKGSPHGKVEAAIHARVPL